jgi:hypothetical protein
MPDKDWVVSNAILKQNSNSTPKNQINNTNTNKAGGDSTWWCKSCGENKTHPTNLCNKPKIDHYDSRDAEKEKANSKFPWAQNNNGKNAKSLRTAFAKAHPELDSSKSYLERQTLNPEKKRGNPSPSTQTPNPKKRTFNVLNGNPQLLALNTKHTKPNVLLDSCSSFHVSSKLDVLNDVCEVTKRVTTFIADGKEIEMTHKGSLTLVFEKDGEETTFNEVYFSPLLDLSNSVILSVGYLDDRLVFTFQKGTVTARLPRGQILMRGQKNQANIYLLDYSTIIIQQQATPAMPPVLIVNTRSTSKKVHLIEPGKITKLNDDQLNTDPSTSENEG